MVDKLPAEVGRRRTETLCRLPVPNGGNGGNVEATPPLPGFPFGRLMTLVPINGNVCSAIQFLEKQGVQGPAIRLPGEWLEVGHVDEVCCFVEERTALVPSPRLAFDLISEQVRLHAGNYEDTFVWGLDPADYVHRMQDILFKRVITNALWNATLSDSATEISGADIAIHMGDYILCDNEVMYVSAKSTSGGSALYTLERDRLENGSQSHAPDAMLMVLSDWSTANIVPDSGQSVQEKIQRVRQKLLEQIPDISFVEAPVFYCYADYGYVAGSPNIVNGIVHGGTVFLPDPGCALFRNAVQLSGKQFVGGPEEWAGFHCYEGEIHCGSEAERILPAEPVWWDKSRFPTWPHQGSPRP